MTDLPALILQSLVEKEDYTRKVLPFIKPEYFEAPEHRHTFDLISGVFNTYNKLPTKEVMLIDLDKKKLPEDVYKSVKSFIKEDIGSLEITTQNPEWLIKTTEEFCKERALYNALVKSIEIAEDKKSKLQTTAIPDILNEALGVSFDTKIGHDYFSESKLRYELYTKKTKKYPFDIDLMNTITDGGVEEKTLNLILGGTNTGKSLALCHLAAAYLRDGLDVLYITLEMAEEKIAARIDANLFDLELSLMQKLPEEAYLKKVEMLRKKYTGNLQIKEYPTATANVNHFRALLNELKQKKNFIPKVIIIDYLSICTSSRVRDGNSYTIVKSIAEEIRGLMVEYNAVGWSAAQMNRGGIKNTDPDLGEVAESFGLSSTADFMVVLITDEEMEARKEILVKQLKNRYGGKDVYRRFMVGFDRSKMKMYNLEQAAQKNLNVDDEAVKTTVAKEKNYSGFNFEDDEE